MGWYGTWNLKYTGNNKQKFLNTAKLVIANFKKRFEISEDGNELEAVKRLSWYGADIDIEKILSYLDDGDQIHVLIDGETHPYDDNDEELEWEEQTYKKQDGQVSMECEYADCDRYKSDRHGMKGAFIHELSYPNTAREETISGGYTDTLDTYIQWIAQEMSDSEEMLPIIQSFLNEIMNISRDEVIEENGKIDEEAFAYFNEIKEKFKTLESTKAYITEVRSKLPPKEKTDVVEMPSLFANMSKRDINQLGGKQALIELYEKEGEEKTRELLTTLGYDLNSAKKEKKQSSVGKKKAESEVNKKIKQSVIDYFLECIKKKYPNLTEKNAKKFSNALGKEIDNKLEYGDFNHGFNIDYDPCEELVAAFYSMDMSNFDSGYPIFDVFPWKTHVSMQRGKCATVSSEYGKSGILYMTDEYRQELLTSINTRILREESKIPQEIKDGFEQEYQTTMEALNIKREPLVKKREEIQRILDQEKALEEKAQQLMDSYASRIDELESLGLPASEMEKRKQAIFQEVQQAQKLANSDRISEQLGEIEEKYGWEDLQEFDEVHKDELNKQAWMRRRYIQYSKEEYEKIWENHKKEHSDPGNFSWPDTSGVPSELDRLYAQKTEIDEYDREHREKEQSNTTTPIRGQEEFVAALGRAYAQYMKEHGNIDEISFRNGREQILADSFSKYFMNNYENLTNSAFLVDFENGAMREIAEENGFKRGYSLFGGWEFNSSTQAAHIKVSEGLIYSVDSILDKVTIEYATPEAIQTQIDNLSSRIRFMQDAGEDLWSLKRLESQRNSFISYQRQLQGKPEIEPSLEELDQQKHILETLDGKATKLLQQYDKDNRANQPKVETDGIDFDD